MADGALPIDRVRSATHHGRFFADDDEFSVLTPYEQRRTAHAKRDDPARRRVLYRELMVHVTCPICLEPLTCTRTTKECMHRFCKSCIEESLRKTKRECPTCRKPLASHRALREDTNFDALIKLFIPDRDAFLQRERLRLQRIQEFTNPHALSESVNTGLREQAAQAKRAKIDIDAHIQAPLIQADRVASRRLRGHDGRSSSTPSTWGNNDMGDRVEADFVTQADHERRTVLPACDEIQCILRPWSAAPADVPLPELHQPYIAAPRNCTIGHIRVFVLQVLQEEYPDVVDALQLTDEALAISVPLPLHGHPRYFLQPTWLLERVAVDHQRSTPNSTHGNGSLQPFVLHYALAAEDEDEDEEEVIKREEEVEEDQQQQRSAVIAESAEMRAEVKVKVEPDLQIEADEVDPPQQRSTAVAESAAVNVEAKVKVEPDVQIEADEVEKEEGGDQEAEEEDEVGVLIRWILEGEEAVEAEQRRAQKPPPQQPPQQSQHVLEPEVPASQDTEPMVAASQESEARAADAPRSGMRSTFRRELRNLVMDISPSRSAVAPLGLADDEPGRRRRRSLAREASDASASAETTGVDRTSPPSAPSAHARPEESESAAGTCIHGLRRCRRCAQYSDHSHTHSPAAASWAFPGAESGEASPAASAEADVSPRSRRRSYHLLKR